MVVLEMHGNAIHALVGATYVNQLQQNCSFLHVNYDFLLAMVRVIQRSKRFSVVKITLENRSKLQKRHLTISKLI